MNPDGLNKPKNDLLIKVSGQRSAMQNSVIMCSQDRCQRHKDPEDHCCHSDLTCHPKVHVFNILVLSLLLLGVSRTFKTWGLLALVGNKVIGVMP